MSVGSNNSVKIGVAVVLLLAAAGILLTVRGGTQPPGDGSVYFYDLTSGELFMAPDTARPPIDAPGGAGKGVRAFVYACGECSPATQRIGYLLSVSPQARAMMDKPLEQADPAVLQNGQLIATPPEQPGGDVTWVVRNTPAGATVARTPEKTCDSVKTSECLPN